MIEPSFFSSLIIKKSLDFGLRQAEAALAKLGSRILTSAEDITISLESHLQTVQAWTAEIAFADLSKAKLTQKVFIQLDCYVMQRRLRIGPKDSAARVPLESLFSEAGRHYLFLGAPGAGKTTSMKHLCYRLLTDDRFASGRNLFPILVKLRDLDKTSGKNPLLFELATILGVKFQLPPELEGRSTEATRLRSFAVLQSLATILNESPAFIILDGLDEISDFNLREQVIEDIRSLTLKLSASTLVFTCRTGEFLISMESVQVFEICPLTDKQISKFAERWLNGKKHAQSFLGQVKASPFSDSAIKPLNLAHLCALYERSGSIPEKPKTVYKKILNLLLNDWDEQRSVKRRSRYAKFEPDRKYDLLCTLAYLLTTQHHRLTFDTQVITSIYRSIHRDFDLPENEAKEVAKELESHTGLLLQCGFDEYEFAHKSLHEFLASEFLVRLPSIPSDAPTIARLANELAIAVSISSNSSLYFTELVFNVFSPNHLILTGPFFGAFVARLIQERPDFNSQPKVVLALLTLYSISIDSFSNQHGQFSLFLTDPLLDEFESLLQLVTSVNEIKELDRFYIFVRQTGTLNNQAILQYKRVHQHTSIDLLDHLYVRQSFVHNISTANVIQQQLNI